MNLLVNLLHITKDQIQHTYKHTQSIHQLYSSDNKLTQVQLYHRALLPLKARRNFNFGQPKQTINKTASAIWTSHAISLCRLLWTQLWFSFQLALAQNYTHNVLAQVQLTIFQPCCTKNFTGYLCNDSLILPMVNMLYSNSTKNVCFFSKTCQISTNGYTRNTWLLVTWPRLSWLVDKL